MCEISLEPRLEVVVCEERRGVIHPFQMNGDNGQSGNEYLRPVFSERRRGLKGEWLCWA